MINDTILDDMKWYDNRCMICDFRCSFISFPCGRSVKPLHFFNKHVRGYAHKIMVKHCCTVPAFSGPEIPTPCFIITKPSVVWSVHQLSPWSSTHEALKVPRWWSSESSREALWCHGHFGAWPRWSRGATQQKLGWYVGTLQGGAETIAKVLNIRRLIVVYGLWYIYTEKCIHIHTCMHACIDT